MKTIPSVNKTDVLTMLQGFQNFKGKNEVSPMTEYNFMIFGLTFVCELFLHAGVCEADEQQLLLCPGNNSHVFSVVND